MKPVRMFQAFARAVYPSRCLACGSLFFFRPPAGTDPDDPCPDAVFLDAFSPYVCPDCLIPPFAVGPPLCPSCGRGFPSETGGDHLCGACLAAPPVFDGARSMGKFDGTLRAIIHDLKYHRAVHLARPLGRWMAVWLMAQWPEPEVDMILPVPLHPKRLRHREYNQCGLVVRHLLSFLGRPENSRADSILVRKKYTPTQTGLNPRQRRENMRGAFSVLQPDRVAGKRILLVDDVWTTGATTSSCCRELKKAGAEALYVLTLARASLS